jgi:hypothetical protein
LYNTFPKTEEEKALWFSAEMNYRQFKSLSHKLENSDIENEILNNQYFIQKVSKSVNLNLVEVNQWLKNAWNTESILIQNIDIIANTGQSFCMQWAFPQAYYSVFGTTLAKFKAIGMTESSHTSVLRKYGSLMLEKKLPESISIYCNGIAKNIAFENIVVPKKIDRHMDLNLNDDSTIDNHICQFLKATRLLRLKEKAPSMGFKKPNGEKRINLNDELWTKVSNSIGNTTIFDFLYRKRIKGNYQDIETYNSPYFKGKEVLESLISVIDRINLVNEVYTCKAIGKENYNLLVERQLKLVQNENLAKRLLTTNSIIDTL